MPDDNAQRVVAGARALSPFLGSRMLAAHLLEKSVFIRELLPQDLKLEIERLRRDEALGVAEFLALVVGRAHARQMNAPTESAGSPTSGATGQPPWTPHPGCGAASSISPQPMRRPISSTVAATPSAKQPDIRILAQLHARNQSPACNQPVARPCTTSCTNASLVTTVGDSTNG